MTSAQPAADETREHRIALVVIAVVTIVVAWIGWRTFLFLTDDAFIAFRYVSNSMMGRGFVWNPAPFHPVEGYTSFLWVVLLKYVWKWTGIEPPVAANPIAFVCGLGTLWLTARFVWRMRLPAALERARIAFLCLVLAGVLTNRTFLTWLSSGLETALFNLLLTWWLFEALAPEGREQLAWSLRLSLSAALCTLCRPDGLLLVAATPVIWLAERLLDTGRTRRPAIGLMPLLIVPAQFLWRHATYGDWLPNTYYAKYVAPWPASGVRYLGSFILEYGVWWWILLAAIALGIRARMKWNRTAVVRSVVPIGAIVAHFAYYTFVIGGDHFEYRVYSHLIPLLFVSAVVFAVWITPRRWVASAAVAGFIVVSWPIQWVHWWDTRNLTEPIPATILMPHIAQQFPAPLRPIVRQWGDWQEWLNRHYVCRRQHEHKLYEEGRIAMLPKGRAEGLRIPWSVRDVAVARAVGVIGWTLPNVAIIDAFGLNDRVIAHHPVRVDPRNRLMAHERRAPRGYIDCWHPNLWFDRHPPVIEARKQPLTDDEIRDCESRDWK